MAWHHLGWKPAFFSEIDAAPRAVLSHHYPDVPLHGDFTTIGADDYGPIDLLVGGTPCQSFSVAGLRGGLDDDRGNLALEYIRLARRKRARWVGWENVPGVFSSNGGEDFRCFLSGLVGWHVPFPAGGWQNSGIIAAGPVHGAYGVAWRVLDAQFFGVPQRRRRVILVGYLGDWRRAAAVLFERHSLQGHSPPRREKGQAAPTIPSRRSAGGGLGTDFDCDGGLIAGTVRSHPRPGSNDVGLLAFGGGNTSGDIDVAACLVAKGQKCDFEVETFIAHSLRSEGFDASEDGTGRGTPPTPKPFDTTQITSAANYSNPKPGDPCHPLASGAHPPAIAFDCKASGQNGFGVGDVMSTLRSMGHKDSHTNGGGHASVAYGSAVRRLTPRECERLQGFPDDFTLVPHRGKLMADGPRYKMLGNSMAVPCMRWIGERIAAVEALQLERKAA